MRCAGRFSYASWVYGPGPEITRYSIAAVVLYNLLLLAADGAALRLLARRRTGRRLLAGLGGGLVLTCLLTIGVSGLFHGGVFMALGLLAHGLFGHGLVMLCGSAWLLRGERARCAAACGLLGVVLAGVAIYAFCLEPQRLELSEFRLSSDKLTQPIRILVIADLQADSIGDYERSVLRRAMQQRPDLILLPGDFLQEWDDRRRSVLVERLRAVLRDVDLSARLGVFAVNGNTEGPGWQRIFSGLPVQMIGDRSRVFTSGEVQITALEMWDSFNVRLEVPAARKRFHIVFGHSPDFALGRIDADLLVAGHTHGGQVRLPTPRGLLPLITFSRIPRAWAQGMTRLSGGRALVVSRGIGMERGAAPRLRFLCRPQLVLIQVDPVR